MKIKICKYIIAGFILTMVIGLTACGKEEKIEKQLTLGQTYMNEGRYVRVEVEDWLDVSPGKYPYYVVYRDLEDGTRLAYWGECCNVMAASGIYHFK